MTVLKRKITLLYVRKRIHDLFEIKICIQWFYSKTSISVKQQDEKPRHPISSGDEIVVFFFFLVSQGTSDFIVEFVHNTVLF